VPMVSADTKETPIRIKCYPNFMSLILRYGHKWQDRLQHFGFGIPKLVGQLFIPYSKNMAGNIGHVMFGIKVWRISQVTPTHKSSVNCLS
ncbi:MAG: hypothetical protein CUN52_07945, partial [Phototrophicales bacterium]